MLYPGLLTPYAFVPWGALTGSVPQVPDFYWNAVSDEQRWKQLCVNMQAIADWSKAFSDLANNNFTELDARFPVTDNELASDVPVIRGGTVADVTIPRNSSLTLETAYPAALAEGVPDAIILTVEDRDTHNTTAQVVSKDDERFTALLVNNSVTDATVTLHYILEWNSRPQPTKDKKEN